MKNNFCWYGASNRAEKRTSELYRDYDWYGNRGYWYGHKEYNWYGATGMDEVKNLGYAMVDYNPVVYYDPASYEVLKPVIVPISTKCPYCNRQYCSCYNFGMPERQKKKCGCTECSCNKKEGEKL